MTVSSVFGRALAVIANVNDYAASLIQNDSSVTGATVKLALNNLLAAIPSVPVSSVFARTGAVVATLNDYAASLIQNDSSVAGATVKLALNNLLAAIPSAIPTSVFSRIGAVVATLNDYAASLIQNDSRIGHTTVKSSLDTLLNLAVGNFAYIAASGTGGSPPGPVPIQLFIPRKNDALTVVGAASGYAISLTGTFTFTVEWRVNTPLVTDSITLELFKNGVGTGVSGTMLPGVTTGQFSGNITTAIGDVIAVGVLQSGAEPQQNNWLLNTSTYAN